VTPRERWEALSGRERTLVLGAGGLALLVFAYYGTLPGDELLESGSVDSPWVQVARIDNYRRVLAHTDAIEKQTAEIESRLKAQQERLPAGGTPNQVAAELQGSVSTMASEAGLNVLSSQILKEEEVDGSKRVGVRLTLSGEIEGVAKLIQAIESGPMDMLVSHLEINRKLGSTRRPTPTKATTEQAQPPLTVSVEIRSFMRQGA
jgi:hypothetical protein